MLGLATKRDIEQIYQRMKIVEEANAVFIDIEKDRTQRIPLPWIIQKILQKLNLKISYQSFKMPDIKLIVDEGPED